MAKSFSGHERNRLFIQGHGNFDDLTLVSGADFQEDSRGFALLDFNRDGWQDMVVSSPQSPRFRILENRMQNTFNSKKFNHCQIRLIGANDRPEISTQWSSRDAIGAELTVTMNGVRQAFQKSVGAGLSSQNSEWIHVGMGNAEKINRIEIRWPSGKKTSHTNISAGDRLTFHERNFKKAEED